MHCAHGLLLGMVCKVCLNVGMQMLTTRRIKRLANRGVYYEFGCFHRWFIAEKRFTVLSDHFLACIPLFQCLLRTFTQPAEAFIQVIRNTSMPYLSLTNLTNKTLDLLPI